MALRGMSQANMELGIFQETKLTNGVYNRRLAGYIVVATYAPIRHYSGTAVFYRLLPRYAVDIVQKFGSNVVGFHMETEERRWYIVRCYLAPDDTFVTVLKESPRDPNCWWQET